MAGLFHSASYCSITPVFSLSLWTVCLSELSFCSFFLPEDALWLFQLSFCLSAVILTGTFGITTTAALCSSAGAPIRPRSSSSTCPPTPPTETLASRPSESWFRLVRDPFSLRRAVLKGEVHSVLSVLAFSSSDPL